ncbi:MAG: tRNA pseudouridine(38-40) synthase TruA [Bacteroidales bacterium]
MRFFILLSYNGSSFNGWQKQKNGPSVQEHLESAFGAYLREKIEITGAGRTDTGVHAVNYVAHLDSCNDNISKDRHLLLYKINAILPAGIVIHDICQVGDSCHSRFDAVSRTYKYYIHSSKSPFLNDISCFYPYKLDIGKMNKAAKLLIGEKDFTSMAKLHSHVKTNICNVTFAKWEELSPLDAIGIPLFQNCSNSQCICFTITANRFLRNMVRAVTGTLLEIGRGIHEPEWIIDVLNEKNRGAAGNSVPAHALFLTAIEYPYEIFPEN